MLKRILFILLFFGFVGSFSLMAQGSIGYDTACLGSTGIYDVQTKPGASFTWKLARGNAMGSIQNISGHSDSIHIVFGNTSGIDTLLLVEQNILGCPGDTSKMVLVLLPNLQVSISGTDSVCANSNNNGKLQILLSGTAPFTFSYTDGLQIFTETNWNFSSYTIPSILYANAGLYTYTLLSASNAGNCGLQLLGSGQIRVFPKPSANPIQVYK